jgi:hypothetical protein
MASRPEWFYRAPDAEELAAAYQGIAVKIPARPAPSGAGGSRRRRRDRDRRDSQRATPE